MAIALEFMDAILPKTVEWTSRQLAIEAYDRFVMGGREPEDFVETIMNWARLERENAITIALAKIDKKEK